MDKYIKFSIGGYFGGYNTIEIFIDGEKISHEVNLSPESLPPMLKPFEKTINAKMWLAELEELNIFSWRKSYVDPHVCDGTQWSLLFKDGKKIYDGGGSNAYPENWIWFIKLINEIYEDFEPMTEIKFTLGNVFDGYKTVEVFINEDEAAYKILRSGLLNVDKKKSSAVEVSDDWLNELDALEIFDWEENYSSEVSDGWQWQLIFNDGRKIYRGQGENAYPKNWERFLDWLDELVPELEFVNRKRLEKFTMNYAEESLTLNRDDKTLTIDKKNSQHIYDLSGDIEKIFDSAQKFFEELEVDEVESDYPARINFELVHHDGSIKTFDMICNENYLPGLTALLNEIHTFATDLTAKIFSPVPEEIVPAQGKYIFCKVQFKGSYKHYTYRTDDETLAVGDVVDVPVGRFNDVNQARIVEIGYFDEYEAPYPIDRIKKIIGKHVADEWENY